MSLYIPSCYGIAIWDSASKTLSLHIHFSLTSLIYLININSNLVSFFVYDILNNIGPTRLIMQFAKATEVHNGKRNGTHGNLNHSWDITTRFHLKVVSYRRTSSIK